MFDNLFNLLHPYLLMSTINLTLNSIYKTKKYKSINIMMKLYVPYIKNKLTQFIKQNKSIILRISISKEMYSNLDGL